MSFKLLTFELFLLVTTMRAYSSHDLISNIHLSMIPAGNVVSWSSNQYYLPNSATVTYYSFADPTALINSTNEITVANYTAATWYYHAKLRNLLNSTVYSYGITVAINNSLYNSSIYSFSSPLAVGASPGFNITILGDLGAMSDNSSISLLNSLVRNEAKSTIDLMYKLMPTTNFYLHVGDIGYSDLYWLHSSTSYDDTWQKFLSSVSDLTAYKPYLTLPGNHDVCCNQLLPLLCASNYRNFSAYNSIYRMPSSESRSPSNTWYSLDYGLTHLISLNMETSFPDSPSGPGSYLDGPDFAGQLEWLQLDLAAAVANRNNVPWIIIAGHRPFRASAVTSICASCKTAFEKLFYDYSVDIYFSAHIHYYEALFPLDRRYADTDFRGYSSLSSAAQSNYSGNSGIYRSFRDSPYPIYIVNGAAGNTEGAESFIAPQQRQSYSAELITLAGVGQLEIFNHSHAQWRYILALNHTVAHTISIIKTRNQATPRAA
jgi:hypothetical protein